MIISKEQMQRIVEEMEETIRHPINIMDESGRIIASTDPARIGALHRASRILLERKLDQLVLTREEEERYEGSRQGVNLPILIHGQAAGVVGITGDPKKVKVFGSIIKRMTEILISEAIQKEQALLYDNAKNTFLYSWLFERGSDPEEARQMELGGQLLGIDTALPRIAAVMKPKADSGKASDALGVQKLITALNRIVALCAPASEGHVTLAMGSQLLLLYGGSDVQSAAHLCRTAAEAFRSQTQLPLAVGIGTCATGRECLQKSCREAEQACYLALHTRTSEICFFEESDLSLLLQQLPGPRREKYLKQLFSGHTSDELRQWMLLLRVFFDCNGSITQAAGRLYIHKNTLQYRLNKLKQLTGCDPRNTKEAFSLYAALTIYESLEIEAYLKR